MKKKLSVSSNHRRMPPTPSVHELWDIELAQARGGTTPPAPPAATYISWDVLKAYESRD
jgi:hypothetical protein